MSIPLKSTVVVVGWDGNKWLPDCLRTLAEASTGRLQLCLVDNYKNPCLETLDLTAFELEVLKTPKPMGFAEANNYGLQHTRFDSDITVFLNQDTVSSAGWIDKCAALFAADEKLGIVSSGTRNYEQSEWEDSLSQCVTRSGRSMDSLDPKSDELFRVPEVTAAAVAIRTSVLREVGPFDPLYGSYYEDYDLCLRVECAGYGIGICPSAFVGHFGSSTTQTEAARRKRMRSLIRNGLIYRVRRNADRRVSALANHLFYTLPVNLLRGLMGTPSSQPVPTTIAAHWDLLKIAGRLISSRADDRAWRDYLRELGWSDAGKSEAAA